MNSIGVILLEIESILSNWKSVHECGNINEANGNQQLIISRFVSHQLFSELSILIKPFRLKELANQKALITACEETLTSNTAQKVESPVFQGGSTCLISTTLTFLHLSNWLCLYV